MPTTIGKKLRSRKVQLACERRQNQYAENDFSDKKNAFGVNDPNYTNLQTLEETKQGTYHLIPQTNSFNDTELKVITRGNFSLHKNLVILTKLFMSFFIQFKKGTKTQAIEASAANQKDQYDTVSSFHEIEQDDHKYYNRHLYQTSNGFERNRLGQINETPTIKNNGSKSNNVKQSKV